MNELINLVTQKTGIPPDKARTAVQTVIGYLKDKLPAPIAAQLDGLVGGTAGSAAPAPASGEMGEIMNDVGAIFGNK
jgi:hypothetical protein